MTRIAVNGFGRIGRQIFKAIWQHYPQLEVVAIVAADGAVDRVRADDRDEPADEDDHAVPEAPDGETAHADILHTFLTSA